MGHLLSFSKGIIRALRFPSFSSVCLFIHFLIWEIWLHSTYSLTHLTFIEIPLWIRHWKHKDQHQHFLALE